MSGTDFTVEVKGTVLVKFSKVITLTDDDDDNPAPEDESELQAWANAQIEFELDLSPTDLDSFYDGEITCDVVSVTPS